jgi:hypothetical protein
VSAEADAILEEAYRILSEEKDWCQTYTLPAGSFPAAARSVCALAALDLATQRVVGTRWGQCDWGAHERFCAAAGIGDEGSVGEFNDDPHTTKEDVLLALKRARYDFGDAP